MKSDNYWANRANQRMDDYILQSEKTANEIAKAYYQAAKNIESDMAKVVKGLGAISSDESALRNLKFPPNKTALASIRAAVNSMPEGQAKQEALTALASPAYQFRMRRLQATIDNARKECERLYKAELKDTTAHLKNLYSDAFNHTMYDIDKGYNTLHTYSQFPESRVTKLLKSQWSGANYSSRIWNSTSDLAASLKEQMLIAYMTGASVSEVSRAIMNEFQSSAYAARRLVRTETNFVANQAELDAYRRLGIEEYKYIATLDTRTSTICQSLDGRVFNVEDGKAGVNLPPMHPNCRSTTIMYDADSQIKERAARDENGKRITVPGDTTYKEWQEKYHPELIQNDLISSRNSDKIESELGKFKNQISESKEISKDYYNMLKTRFSHMSDRAKRVYNKYVTSDSVIGDFEGTAHYENGKIYMHFGSDLKNERGKGATWFHEHAHMIDELSGGVSTKNYEFYQSLSSEYTDYIGKMRIQHPELSAKEIQSLISSELSDYRRHSAVSDLFHGLSDERITGCATHPRRLDGSSYWNKETVSQEAFAHMFECQSDVTRYNEMKKYFPKSLEFFEKMLEVM